MKYKKQCWEVKNCGREPHGENAERLGVCLAAVPGEFDGVNGGVCAGRFCWSVAGTLCGGEPQGTYSQKIKICLTCEFLLQVEKEEGKNTILSPQHAIYMRELEALRKKK